MAFSITWKILWKTIGFLEVFPLFLIFFFVCDIHYQSFLLQHAM